MAPTLNDLTVTLSFLMSCNQVIPQAVAVLSLNLPANMAYCQWI